MPSQEKTQILFNSPALHALKRDQLIKLCKAHSIKASGKSVDLIERLKQHARSLPVSSCDIAAYEDSDGGREEHDGNGDGEEKWDVSLEDGREGVEMGSMGGGTLSSSLRSRTTGSTASRGERGGGGGGNTPGEFGTSNSKCQSYYIITRTKIHKLNRLCCVTKPRRPFVLRTQPR